MTKKKIKNKIFGFTHKYPQSFLDKLAKDLGFKWTKVKFKTVKKEDINIMPLSSPSLPILYIKYKY